MNPTLQLHLAINAIVPIVGVSVGDPSDKTTWQVTCAQEPTEIQKSQIQEIVNNFDFTLQEL